MKILQTQTVMCEKRVLKKVILIHLQKKQIDKLEWQLVQEDMSSSVFMLTFNPLHGLFQSLNLVQMSI